MDGCVCETPSQALWLLCVVLASLAWCFRYKHRQQEARESEEDRENTETLSFIQVRAMVHLSRPTLHLTPSRLVHLYPATGGAEVTLRCRN